MKILVFLAIFGGVITVAWIFFMPMLLTSTLAKRTGFDVKVERLVFNPFSARVDVTGLLITNPDTFPRRDYVQVRTFQVEAPLGTLFSDYPEFDLVRIDISHIALVRNTDGTLNATLFYDRLVPPPKASPEEEEKMKKTAKSASKSQQPPPPPARPYQKPMPYLIRRLELKVDRMTLDDHSARSPSLREFNLAIDQTFLDVTGAKQLMTPSMLRALSPVATAIGGLIPGDMGRVLSAAAGNPETKTPQDEMKSIVDTLEESRKP